MTFMCSSSICLLNKKVQRKLQFCMFVALQKSVHLLIVRTLFLFQSFLFTILYTGNISR